MPKPFPPWEIKTVGQYRIAEIWKRQVPEICFEWLLKTIGCPESFPVVRIKTVSPVYLEFVDRVKYELDKQDTIFGEVEEPKKKGYGVADMLEYQRQQMLNQREVISVEAQAKLYNAVNNTSERSLVTSQPYSKPEPVLKPKRKFQLDI